MTPNEVIERARVHFGETTAATLDDPTFEDWFNDALQEVYRTLYTVLPGEELKFFLQETNEPTTGGALDIPDEWDRIIDVLESNNEPIHYVDPEMMPRIDSGTYYVPMVPVWTVVAHRLWVRPDSINSVNITYLAPPEEVTDFDQEINAIPSDWQPALVWVLTSYAYAQEEDLQQTEYYRGKFLSMLPQAESA